MPLHLITLYISVDKFLAENMSKVCSQNGNLNVSATDVEFLMLHSPRKPHMVLRTQQN